MVARNWTFIDSLWLVRNNDNLFIEHKHVTNFGKRALKLKNLQLKII